MIRLLVALTRNSVIAVDGRLPFRLADDLSFFKMATLNRVVVMGRKTYESIGKPLPDRTNIILSRTLKSVKGCQVFSSIDDVIATFNSDFDVIGGADIYGLFLKLNLIDEVYITDIHAKVSGNNITYFPKGHLDKFKFIETFMTQQKDDRNQASFSISLLKRNSKKGNKDGL